MKSCENSTNQKTSARNDAAWNLLGSLVYAGCQWLVLAATVKLSSAEDVGRLSMGFAITAPIFLLLHLRLRAASATDATVAFTRNDYIVLRMACTALALATTGVVCAVIHLGGEELRVVWLIAVAKAIESGSDLTYGLSQREDNLRAVSLSMTARGVLSVAAFVFLLARTHQLPTALMGLCAAWALVFLCIDLPIANRGAGVERATHSQWKIASVIRLTWLTLPLGLSTMLMSLAANMPRYFIQQKLGISPLGIFSAAGYLTMTGSVVISAIAESSIARMARSLASRQLVAAAAMLQQVRDITILLSTALVGLAIVAGRQILSVLYRHEYGSAQELLVLMMLAAGAANLASVYGYALIAARRFRAHLGSLVLCTISTAIACAFAIPRWGMLGAAMACMAGYTLQAASSWALLRPAFAQPKAASLASVPALNL